MLSNSEVVLASELSHTRLSQRGEIKTKREEMANPGDLITDGMIINAEFELTQSCSSSFISSSSVTLDESTALSIITLDENTPLRKESYQFINEFVDSPSYNNSIDVCYESTSYDTLSSSSTLQNHSYGSTCSTMDTKIHNTPSPSSQRTVRTKSSYALRSSMLTTFAEDVCSERNSTVLSTVFNILPLLLGTPIFVIPFAFITGGLYFIPVAVALCVFADISSNLLVECLYTTRDRRKRRIHNGFYDVSSACLGKFWANAMYSIVIFYLVTNNIINVMVFDACFRNLVAKVIPMNILGTTIVYGVIFTSILFVKKVPVFVFNVFIGVLSLLVASLTAMSVFLENADTWPANYNNIPLVNEKDFAKGFALATAMFMYSLLANPVIPEIEGGMINPQKMGIALHISYGISSVCKIFFGLFGMLTYALHTNELIATNIMEGSSMARFFIAISLLLCTFSNCTLPYYVLFDKLDQLIETSFSHNLGEGGRLHVLWLILSRTVGVTCTVFIGIRLPCYASVTGVVGSIAGAVVTLVFPFVFHLRLYWEHISVLRKGAELFLFVVGVVISLVTIYESFSFFVAEVCVHNNI